MSDLGFMGRIAESKIQEAIDEGKFDDLPGKGKPIVFDDDPMTPPHLRLLNRILSNANVLPEWMQIQKDLEAERQHLAEMRHRLIRENQRWGARIAKAPSSPGVAQYYVDWREKSRAEYLRLIKSVNSSILKFTLSAPSTAAPMVTLKIDVEMEAFDSDVPAHIAPSNGARPRGAASVSP